MVPIPNFSSTYKQTGFEEDADRIVSFYRDRGYLAARVGQPTIRTLEDTEDGRTRWVALNIPVTEGEQYRIGELTVEGSKEVPSAICCRSSSSARVSCTARKRFARD